MQAGRSLEELSIASSIGRTDAISDKGYKTIKRLKNQRMMTFFLDTGSVNSWFEAIWQWGGTCAL